MSKRIAPFTCPPSEEGEECTPGSQNEIAAGVVGYWFDAPQAIYIPLVIAKRPGSGDVSRFLDALPRSRRIVFSNVVTAKLAAMLAARGFSHTENGFTDDWVREVGTTRGSMQKLQPITMETPSGTPVIYVDDEGVPCVTKTRSDPWCIGDGTPVVLIDGRTGGYLASRVFALEAPRATA